MHRRIPVIRARQGGARVGLAGLLSAAVVVTWILLTLDSERPGDGGARPPAADRALGVELPAQLATAAEVRPRRLSGAPPTGSAFDAPLAPRDAAAQPTERPLGAQGRASSPHAEIEEVLATLQTKPFAGYAQRGCYEAIAVRLSSENRYTVLEPDSGRYRVEGVDVVFHRVFDFENRLFSFDRSEFPIFARVESSISAAKARGAPAVIEPGSELWFDLVAFLEESLAFPED